VTKEQLSLNATLEERRNVSLATNSGHGFLCYVKGECDMGFEKEKQKQVEIVKKI